MSENLRFLRKSCALNGRDVVAMSTQIDFLVTVFLQKLSHTRSLVCSKSLILQTNCCHSVGGWSQTILQVTNPDVDVFGPHMITHTQGLAARTKVLPNSILTTPIEADFIPKKMIKHLLTRTLKSQFAVFPEPVTARQMRI